MHGHLNVKFKIKQSMKMHHFTELLSHVHYVNVLTRKCWCGKTNQARQQMQQPVYITTWWYTDLYCWKVKPTAVQQYNIYDDIQGFLFTNF